MLGVHIWYLFIFILELENGIRQKAKSAHFLLEFKMGHKALTTTFNIKNTFGPETAKKTYSVVVVQEVLQR